jgi:hypothetical protein
MEGGSDSDADEDEDEDDLDGETDDLESLAGLPSDEKEE